MIFAKKGYLLLQSKEKYILGENIFTQVNMCGSNIC